MRILPFVLAALLTPLAAAQTTFTYQGRLDNAGVPAQGNYDLRFKLILSDGSQAGPTLCFDNVAIVDGLFTRQLDFGPLFATPTTKYLQVEARADTGLTCANATGFLALSPNQPITSAPLSIQANSAYSLTAPDGSPSPAVSVDNAGNVGIGTPTPLATLDVRSGGGSYVRVDTLNGDLRFNGGADGFFGLYNEGAAAGRTEFLSTAGINLSISNQTGNVGIGVAPTSDKLFVNGTLKVNGPVLYNAPQGSYKSIHGTAFMRQQDHPNMGNFAELALDGAAGGGGGCDDTGWFYAPVELPHGATVTGVVFFYFDNTNCSGFSAEFARVNLFSAAVTHLANLPYEDFNGLTTKTLGTTTITNPLVDNFNYAYVLRCRLQGPPRALFPSGHMRIIGARIAYTVATPVP